MYIRMQLLQNDWKPLFLFHKKHSQIWLLNKEIVCLLKIYQYPMSEKYTAQLVFGCMSLHLSQPLLVCVFFQVSGRLLVGSLTTHPGRICRIQSGFLALSFQGCQHIFNEVVVSTLRRH